MSNIVANKDDLKQFKHNQIDRISEKANSFKQSIIELKNIESEIDNEINTYKNVIDNSKELIKNINEDIRKTKQEIAEINSRISILKMECLKDPKNSFTRQTEINKLTKEMLKLKNKQLKLESLIPKLDSNITFDTIKLSNLTALRKKISNIYNQLTNNTEKIISKTKYANVTISNADKHLQRYCSSFFKAKYALVENSNRQYDTTKYFKPDIDKMIGLSYHEQKKLAVEYNFSSKICQYIRDEREAVIYKNEELEEVTIDGRSCLSAYKKINYDKVDSWGLTNLERMKLGLAPLDDTGTPYELNHIGQFQDSPFAELTKEQHTGFKNNYILHTTSNVKSRVDHFTNYPLERKNHWISLSTIVEDFRKDME